MTYSWGLLGAETVESTKRTRTLGLGAAVRTFNDLAVPGMGGVWFGKQLFLATLGVSVAEYVRNQGKPVDNIRVANAVEALGCWLALNETWEADSRLRGVTKLRNKNKADLSFFVVSKSGFYVSQPMRMATVQALRALGFVESNGERFNSFACTHHGQTFIDIICDDYRSQKTPIKVLAEWINGNKKNINTAGLLSVLSPKTSMPLNARDFLRERLIAADIDGFGANRRKAALNWMEHLLGNPRQKLDWRSKPPMLEQLHWDDLQSGGMFFLTRQAALNVLDQVELQIGNQAKQHLDLRNALPSDIQSAITELKKRATDFIHLSHDPSPSKIATSFVNECVQDDEKIITSLVQRDGRVLKQRNHFIVPGMAFIGSDIAQHSNTVDEQEDSGIETDVSSDMQWPEWPEGISYRMRNLFLLNIDLHGQLDQWLVGNKNTEDE